MKLLVTGASGLVGSAVAAQAAELGHEVVGTVGEHRGAVPGVAECLRIDLSDERELRRLVGAIRPDAIVNAAAVSVPEQCEVQPERSEVLNVRLPRWLAEMAAGAGVRLVHLSSEQVFDGARDTPYSASDPVSPINRYGRQKVASEEQVHAAAGKRAITLRLPLLMGNSVTGARSLHERLLAEWAAGRTARLFVDEIRQTCTAASVAAAILELVARADIHGVHQWAGSEAASRHALGVAVRDRFGLGEKVARIQAVTRAELPELAGRRQACLRLNIAPLAGLLAARPEKLETQVRMLRVPPAGREWLERVGGRA